MPASPGGYARTRPGEAMGFSPGLSGKAKAAAPVYRSPQRREAPGRLRSLRGRSAAKDSGETEAGKEPIRARNVIPGRRGPSSPGGTTGLGPERPRAPAPGSPGRPRPPTRFRPPSVDSEGWQKCRQKAGGSAEREQAASAADPSELKRTRRAPLPRRRPKADTEPAG